MPDVPEHIRKSILQNFSEKKKKEVGNEDNSESKKDVKEPSDSFEGLDSSLDLASALSKMNLFEETMKEQEEKEEELEEAKSIYREKIQKEIVNEKSIDIIRKLDF